MATSSLPTSRSTILRTKGKLQAKAKVCLEARARMLSGPCHHSIQQLRRQCHAKAAHKTDQALFTLAVLEMAQTEPVIFRCIREGKSKVKSASSKARPSGAMALEVLDGLGLWMA